MIEDALKTTRTVERVLLAVSIVALVFVLSIDKADREQRLLDDLERLQSLGKEPYAEFVAKRVRDELGDDLEKTATSLESALEEHLATKGLRVVGQSRIVDVFGKPAHVGRLRPEDLAFGEAASSLADLDRWSRELPLDRDVQTVIAEPDAVLPRIVAFLEQSSRGGMLGPEVGRIDNINLEPLDYISKMGESFVPTDVADAQLVLDFTLVPPDGSSAPVFQELFGGELGELDESSWLYWLEEERGVGGLFKAQEDGVRWLPEISGEDRRAPLSKLVTDLEEEIEATRAEHQTIELPGVTVPGALAIAAIPLALIALLGTMVAHVQHLQRIVEGNEEMLREFAWTPLAESKVVSGIAAIGAFLLLPTGTMAALAWKAGAFDLPWLLSVGWCVLTGITTLGLGASAVVHTNHLRGRLERSKAGDAAKAHKVTVSPWWSPRRGEES